MNEVKLKNLRPGMVLAGNASNIDGRVVLAKGAVLTARHIEIFKAWGIAKVDIVKENSPDSPGDFGYGSGITGAVQAETENLFKLANREHPAVRELMHLRARSKMSKNAGKDARHVA